MALYLIFKGDNCGNFKTLLNVLSYALKGVSQGCCAHILHIKAVSMYLKALSLRDFMCF